MGRSRRRTRCGGEAARALKIVGRYSRLAQVVKKVQVDCRRSWRGGELRSWGSATARGSEYINGSIESQDMSRFSGYMVSVAV